MAAKPSGQWSDRTASRHERGYGSAWVRLREVILRRDLYLCQPCQKAGRTTPATAVDHIRPKASGGSDEAGNLQAICRECHADKTRDEAAAAQGRTAMARTGLDGWPVA